MIRLYETSRVGKSTGTERLGAARSWGRGEQGVSDLMGQSFLSGDENVLELGRLVVTHTVSVLSATEVYKVRRLR